MPEYISDKDWDSGYQMGAIEKHDAAIYPLAGATIVASFMGAAYLSPSWDKVDIQDLFNGELHGLLFDIGTVSLLALIFRGIYSEKKWKSYVDIGNSYGGGDNAYTRELGSARKLGAGR